MSFFLSLQLQITDYSFVGDSCVDVDCELTIYILKINIYIVKFLSYKL